MENNVTEKEVRDLFYNTMLDQASNLDWISSVKLKNDRNTKLGLISLTILEILQSSKDLPDGIELFRGKILRKNTCPETFKELFSSVLRLKGILPLEMKDEIAESCLYKLNLSISIERYFDDNVIEMTTTILKLSQLVHEKEIFHEILSKVAIFYGEIMNEDNITDEMIRDTFYNLMVQEVISSNVMNKSALEECDPFIFFDLSSYTLIEASILSKNVKDGMQILNGQIVTMSNCPINYKDFLSVFLDIKTKISHLSDDDIANLKLVCSTCPDMEVDENIKTPELMNLAVMITQVSTKISQLPTFKNIINHVIQFCLELLN